MSTPDPIHVAFVWHMHQPYYRSARTGAFQMPWARLHAVKDYLDMVEILADYPTIHQTFNLVPSLVEQLREYAVGAPAQADGPVDTGFAVPDIYWEHTTKPAADLLPSERMFVVERMCERPDHPRARSHPRYLELAQKRESSACDGWQACSDNFTADELRDLQIWFNLAWFDPSLLEREPLLSLVQRGRDYREEDKLVLARVQSDILRDVIPAYREAARRGQIELSTSPYYHPILPLLCNTDAARTGAGDTILPHRRFAHPEDAWEQVGAGLAMHQQVFGERPKGMWCSEQAVGEDVLPLLMRAGIEWTISDETVLARSLAGSAGPAGVVVGGQGSAAAIPGGAPGERNRDEDPERRGATSGGATRETAQPVGSPYMPYLLSREQGRLTIVFRDHTLSDLIGFGYQSWNSRDAAGDLLSRIRSIGASVPGPGGADPHREGRSALRRSPLITIALDGENAWEYYPRDGRDFLRYLYEGLADDTSIRCVTVSEHLQEFPATTPLAWLHTGSWIGGNLRTWSGDPAHNVAWDLLHDARDLAASRLPSPPGPSAVRVSAVASMQETDAVDNVPVSAEAAWRHVLVAEGSDWFWWFGEHHHTELDDVWDAQFRQHLQEVYVRLGEPVPIRLYLPVLGVPPTTRPSLPPGPIRPVIDGRLRPEDGWDVAGLLPPDHPSTMQRADGTHIVEARFAWSTDSLYLLVIPRDATDLPGLELELRVSPGADEEGAVFLMKLNEGGKMEVSCSRCGRLAGTATGAWGDVVEVALPLAPPVPGGDDRLGLVLRVGREGMTDHVFRSAGPTRVREAGT